MMDVSSSRVVDDLSDLMRAKVGACLYEYDTEFDAYYANDVDELLGNGHESKYPQKGISKCPSLPSFGCLEADEFVTTFRRMLSEGSLQTPPSCFVSLPKRSVTWAPNVYDPAPTSLLHMIRNKRQHKLKRNIDDKKKIGRKGLKGTKTTRGNVGGKGVKQIRRSSESSYRWFKELVVEDRVVNTANEMDNFNVDKPDAYCGSGFLTQSSTGMFYSVAEAL
ncbi:Levanase [Gossypium australe]|uniref:Levanase n=1 Tax=Gossypium australe TaxID=47621 RepID=A0A5B6VRX6_9ROSI|nr:Levanase [Gossypium australe]